MSKKINIIDILYCVGLSSYAIGGILYLIFNIDGFLFFMIYIIFTFILMPIVGTIKKKV